MQTVTVPAFLQAEGYGVYLGKQQSRECWASGESSAYKFLACHAASSINHAGQMNNQIASVA